MKGVNARGLSSPMPASLAHRVLGILVGVLVAVIVVISAGAALLWHSATLSEEHLRLADEAHSLASLLATSDDPAATLGAFARDEMRITLVGADGQVRFDSKAEPTTLDSHADRPEIAAAQATGSGSSERSSQTLGDVQIYEAVKLDSGDILRLSRSRAGIASLFERQTLLFVGLVVVALLVAWMVSRWLVEVLVAPILLIDPADHFTQAPYVELEPLVHRLHEQHGELLMRVAQLRDTDEQRREFTANVTHELKTPVASILAASELIRDGIAQPADVTDFAGRINDDAQRLSVLIQDILLLSALDECERAGDAGVIGSLEPVDMYRLSREVAARFEPLAEGKAIALTVCGERAEIVGNQRLLDGLIKNLIENAIRYNRDGGSVTVEVTSQADKVLLRVVDTGVGIAPEVQHKVFERFYRVARGRDRQQGGTGLGLAIVKHTARFHQATIQLTSEVGAGTTIEVRFPRVRAWAQQYRDAEKNAID